MKQAREVVEKIEDLKRNSPLLAREISDLSTSTNDPRVEFHNGSWIKVVASNDGARGKFALFYINIKVIKWRKKTGNPPID